MLDDGSASRVTYSGRSETKSSEAAPSVLGGGAQLIRRPPMQGQIGFVGLGRMGAAMAENLVAAGRSVIGYVRRANQMGRLVALGVLGGDDGAEPVGDAERGQRERHEVT